jgi:AraC-like DNA-binding protein
MTETLFVFDRGNYRQCQQLYRGERNQEYYQGQYEIEPGSVIDVRAERRAVGSSSIIRLRSRNRLSFRRSWSHIQMDGIDVGVLWFVKRGSLDIAHSGAHCLAKPGDFAVTHSKTPFLVGCNTDDQSVHEVLHVVVPTEALRRLTHGTVPAGFCTPMSGRQFAVAERILTEVLDDQGLMSEQSSKLLLEGALSLLRDAMVGLKLEDPESKSLPERRLEEVMRYIDIHFCDPTLSFRGIADACGISTRYLAMLLSRQGTNFSNLLWERRLAAAKNWIAEGKSTPISKIAFGVGFKSAAHFSRRFKQSFNITPEEYRSLHSAD